MILCRDQNPLDKTPRETNTGYLKVIDEFRLDVGLVRQIDSLGVNSIDNRLYRELAQPSRRSTKATANGKVGRGKKNDKKSKPKVVEAPTTPESTGWETVSIQILSIYYHYDQC